MLLQKINITIIFLFCAGYISAQTEIDNKIILSGIDSSSRQIQNLGNPKNSTDAVRLEDLKYGQYNFANASGTDTISLTFELPVEKLYNGDLFFFNSPISNNSNITLQIAGMDTLIPLMINDRDTVGRGRIFAGQLVGAIYYRNKAYIISPISKTCPSGFIKVNDNYCIEINERVATDFFSALTICIESNAELCNLSEWYYACTNRIALGLTGVFNNYEWLDDASNDDLQVKTIGYGSCSVIGNVTANVGLQEYRCCYILK